MSFRSKPTDFILGYYGDTRLEERGDPIVGPSRVRVE